MLKPKLSCKENVTCFVQARLASTRLPRKILYRLSDTSILEMVIKRIKKSKNINKIEEKINKVNDNQLKGSLNSLLKAYNERNR